MYRARCAFSNALVRVPQKMNWNGLSQKVVLRLVMVKLRVTIVPELVELGDLGLLLRKTQRIGSSACDSIHASDQRRMLNLLEDRV